ncbi:NAD(P)H-flavin reductase [Alteromonas sp. a30]|uniref:NAD(P)H-flavin reductase n=1 Tax=Alteromonas sp. a30 TaxID=2730917 RepID=UPI00227F36C2|nr:NAD(P)H-flavin reductase [Alteromonas sp. a30]MCY7297154.1 NAD(P)H-flavin reductase [Alteromonas sp. a30]
MTEILCQVESMEPLTPTVTAVTLRPSVEVNFHPGQYIEVIMAENDRRAFSIANAQRTDNKIELHIGASEQETRSLEVLERMKEGEIFISSPKGEAYLRREDPNPMILVAGGTGYSYARSILNAALEGASNVNVTLYWGTRSLNDMYEYQLLSDLALENERFTFIPVVENAEVDWVGKTGWVHKAVVADHQDLKAFSIYVAGRFDMAKVARDDFYTQGLLAENLVGDAYAFI